MAAFCGKSDSTFTGVTRETKVQDVIDNPAFEDYGRLIFPVDRTISSVGRFRAQTHGFMEQ